VIAPLLDHLWQSTLFLAGAWVVVHLLRGRGAHLRYSVWLAASIKFLVPFSLLVTLGARLQPHLGLGQVSTSPVAGVYQAAAWVVAPATRASPDGSPDVANLPWTTIAGTIWLFGVVAFAARWLIRWRRIHAIARSATPTRMPAPVPVLVSTELREPGVVGVLSPVLLIPAGMTDHLTAPQLQAILNHELCHVRRRDNLTASIHMLVEAIFWFYPPVWWIGARLLDERERACDEAVVQSGSDPLIYAEGILTVCRIYVAETLPCVSGVSGADLNKRLEAIMKNEAINRLTGMRKLAVGAIAFSSLAIPVLVGLSTANAAGAKEPAAAAKVELLAGKRVKLDYDNVEVRALLRSLAEAAKVNMLVSDKVGGTVTVHLDEMPWEQALGIVLNSQGLQKREQDGVLFIEPRSN